MNGSTLQKTAADCAEELVTDSYLLVVSHLSKAEQPVDPHTYGSGTRAAR
jgi:hypothetical protein